MRRPADLRGITLFALIIGAAQVPVAADEFGGADFWQGNRIDFPESRISLPPDRPTTGFDPTMFSLADSAMATIAAGAQNAISDRLAKFRNTTIVATRNAAQYRGGSLGPPASALTVGEFSVSGIGGWSHVFGLSIDQISEPLDETTSFSGATVGFDTPLSQNSIGGFFVGGSSGTISEDDTSKDLSTNGFYGGLYLTKLAGRYFIDVTLSGGMTEQDSSRYDFETADAEASYAGYFVNPSLKISTFTDIAGHLVLPSVSFSYAGFFFDSYNEHGSSQSLAVDERQTHLLTGRAQITVPHEQYFDDGSALRLEAHGGVQARLNLSDETLAASRRGLNFTFQPYDDAQEVGIYLGADVNYLMNSGILLFGELQGVINTNGSIDALAQFGTRFSF